MLASVIQRLPKSERGTAGLCKGCGGEITGGTGLCGARTLGCCAIHNGTADSAKARASTMERREYRKGPQEVWGMGTTLVWNWICGGEVLLAVLPDAVNTYF
jgi:hypothetical protein